MARRAKGDCGANLMERSCSLDDVLFPPVPIGGVCNTTLHLTPDRTAQAGHSTSGINFYFYRVAEKTPRGRPKPTQSRASRCAASHERAAIAPPAMC